MFICKFCQKEYSMNAGGMVHQNQCKLNPLRVSYQLGRAAWNKGKTAASDSRVALISAKVSINRRGKKPGNWNPHRNKLEQYRIDCAFKFSVYDFPDEFNVSLLEEKGWYKAKNNGNNLHGVSRDHMISVKYGWENGIDSNIISHPANCELLVHSDNVRKYSKNSICLEELLSRIEVWNCKYFNI